MAKLITITLLLDVVDEAGAIDWINKKLAGATPGHPGLVDYAIVGNILDASEEINDSICNETYEEGDVFTLTFTASKEK